MGIDLQEDPPIKPGQPTEPPQEDPPGNPRPEIPPPMQDPGEPSRPQELPGRMPDELPVRGPPAPQTPATDSRTTDLPGSDPNVSLGSAAMPPRQCKVTPTLV
jgi:hypothetical protein